MTSLVFLDAMDLDEPSQGIVDLPGFIEECRKLPAKKRYEALRLKGIDIQSRLDACRFKIQEAIKDGDDHGSGWKALNAVARRFKRYYLVLHEEAAKASKLVREENKLINKIERNRFERKFVNAARKLLDPGDFDRVLEEAENYQNEPEV